jgi:hypothetical protein
LEVLSR